MRARLPALILLTVMMTSVVGMIPILPDLNDSNSGATEVFDAIQSIPQDVTPLIEQHLAESTPSYPESLDLNDILGNRENIYKSIYEPWKSKAAIHAIAYDEPTGFLALGGGYLYDNEVHLFRLNIETEEFDKVYELGDGVIRSDVLSVDFGDTDLNDFLEVVVASSDGHVYVFEQKHLYDPYTNTENMFDHVWTSPGLFRAFSVKVDDIDRDYRPDIIAGCWDGFVHLYEYDNHSGYPFVEEHWITYREVAKLDVGEKIYSLETGDTNYNGLPEIIVGTREGTVFVFENAGTSIMINDQPFPLIWDNKYTLKWTSENYTWQPIRSIAVGELDTTPGDEIALVAEGQGVFTLDWDESSGTYEYRKVQRDYAAWETFGFHGLDYWVDSLVSANNVTYYDPINDTLIIEEPIEYTWNEALEIFLPNASVYPYNTGMAQQTDGNYSRFDATLSSVDNATAIVDFGLDEEGTGSANADADLIITFKDPLTVNIVNQLNFSIGQTATEFFQVDTSQYTVMPADQTKLMIDVDDVLTREKIDWFRYAKISVYNSGNYSINSIELLQVYNLLTDALSLTIGPFRTDGDAYLMELYEPDKIVVATVTGEFAVISYDTGSGKYKIDWESYDDERFTLGANVWDIEHIVSVSDVPIWINVGTLNNIAPDFGNYNSWHYGILSPITMGGDGSPSYVIGTDTSVVRATDMSGEVDFTMNGYLAAINTGTRHYTSAEVASLWPNTPQGLMPMVVVGSYDPEGRYADPTSWSSRSNIEFYYRNTPFESYMYLGSIKAFDFSGQIVQLLSMSQATPRLSFADYDNDNDLDMVLSNGYVYLAKNLFTETDAQQFQLMDGHFNDINLGAGSIIWGQPQMIDINGDGVLDLILNYEEKYGATCFLNLGTPDNPIWKEDRRIFNNADPDTAMTILKLTDIRLVPNTGGYTLQRYGEFADVDLVGDFSLAAHQNDTDSLRWAIANYEAIDSYLVATYPRVSKMDFALMKSESFKNLGFHIHESWNTDFDLEDWTLSVSSGDLDGDGRGEIIVGDYDNNVYAFEHLTGTTYKRMFRSYDLNHTEIVDSSPYAYDELEGISGEFNRKIWDHAKHLLSDTDLDQDGLRELVITSDLQVYIYEATGIDDTLTLAYKFDLRNLGYLDEESDAWEDVTEITAVEAGVDLDNDGRKDLVLAVGPFLFVFNVDVDSFEGLEDNDFFGWPGDMDGRYYLLGNPEGANQYEHADIKSLAVADTDNDNHNEIILGGVYDSSVQRPSGFVYVYECLGGTFQKVWEAPADIVNLNPISVVLVDDQDYDTNLEIIIGHSKGFDVMEWSEKTGTYNNTAKVTSSPNYPTIDLQSTLLSGFDSITFTNRCANDMAYSVGGGSNLVIMVIVNNEQLEMKSLNTDTLQVTSMPYVPFITQTVSGDYGDVTVVSEIDPSITSDNETIWLSWKAERNTGTFDFWVSKINSSEIWWSDPVWVVNNTESFGSRNNPEVFVYNSTHIGIMYTNTGYDTSEAYYYLMPKDLSNRSGPYLFSFPGWDTFDVRQTSVVRLPGGDFMVAMSAINSLSSKGDYDIWTLYANASFNFNNSIPHQATSSFYDEMYPDADYLRSESNPIVITYEVGGAPFEKRTGMVSSLDNGSTWSEQKSLNTYPQYLSRDDYPAYPAVYYYDIGGVPHSGPMTYSPSVLGLPNAGFLYLQSFNIYNFIGSPSPDIIWGYNPSSDWVNNHLHDISNMVVGDTDSDGRREVIVSYDATMAVYEMLHSNNGTGYMNYIEAYLSDPFIYDITDLTTYDSNGNGWQEIGVSCERGEVFVMEYQDPSHGATPFGFSDTEWTTNIPGYVTPWSIFADDFDGDAKEELIVNSWGGNLFCMDDDLSILWNRTLTLGSSVVIDLDGDLVPELVSYDSNDNVIALNGSTGDVLWNYTGSTGEVSSIQTADIDVDSDVEVLFTSDDGKLWTLTHDGQYVHDEALEIDDFYILAIGDFTNQSTLGVAYLNRSWLVKVVNPLNGSQLYESPPGLTPTYYPIPAKAHDFNEDGYDDLLVGKDMVHIIDIVQGTIFYNTSINGLVDDIIVDDFDGDNTIEVFVQTRYDGVYLEQVSTRQIEWWYNQSIGKNRFSVPGVFGGTGNLDIALSVETGYLILLDGKNGIPMWFNITGNWLDEMIGVDFAGNGTDTLIACVFNSTSFRTEMTAFSAESRVWQPTSTGPTKHETYWKQDLGESTITGIWTENINGDPYDDIFIATDSNYLSFWDTHNARTYWNISIPGPINQLRFGQLDGGLDTEIAVSYDDTYIRLLDSEDGSTIGSLKAPFGFEIRDFYVSGFDMDPYDDIVVLYEKESPSNLAFVSFYDSDGTWKYNSDTNTTDGGAYMTVGYFRNSLTPDVVFGGRENIAYVLRGDNGNMIWSLNIFTDIQGIVAGYFDDDNYEDFALKTSGSIRVVNSSSTVGTELYSVGVLGSNLWGYYGVDLIGDTTEELVINARFDGVRGYNSSGEEVWSYEAPLVFQLYSGLSTCSFGEMDLDSKLDVVLTNGQYINIISGATQDLLWHYVHHDGMSGTVVGMFDAGLGPLDVGGISGSELMIVSGSATPPPPPSPVAAASSFSISRALLRASIAGVPLLIVISLIAVHRRKRQLRARSTE